MTVLVTGGAGYIGSHTARLLRERGREVVVLDSLEYGHRAAVLGAPLVVGAIDDQALVAEHGVDSCIHFAAYKNAGESVLVPERYWRNNVVASFGLFEGLRTAGVHRIVFSSSCAAYGTPTQLPVNEDHRLAPESPYGESKLMVETMLRWYDRAHRVRSVSLRYFNAAGASRDAVIGEDWSLSLNLVPVVMKAALGRIGPIEVFGTDYPTGDGTAVRDYIHVEDLADAHLKALEYLEAGGDSTVLNLGTGTPSSVREVIELTEKISGRPVPCVEVGRRVGDPVSVYADNRKARAVLGWLPDHGLEAILTSAWRWHSSHPEGYAVAKPV
jgi:UDP-glucose 4-epimerase